MEKRSGRAVDRTGRDVCSSAGAPLRVQGVRFVWPQKSNLPSMGADKCSRRASRVVRHTSLKSQRMLVVMPRCISHAAQCDIRILFEACVRGAVRRCACVIRGCLLLCPTGSHGWELGWRGTVHEVLHQMGRIPECHLELQFNKVSALWTPVSFLKRTPHQFMHACMRTSCDMIQADALLSATHGPPLSSAQRILGAAG